ncbi:hypothetical protein CISIN_1g0372472mg, partial [Citrus sinensis]
MPLYLLYTPFQKFPHSSKM